MAFFTTVRVATASETPHTQRSHLESLCMPHSVLSSSGTPSLTRPLQHSSWGKLWIPTAPQHPELLYYSPNNEQIKVFRVCNSFSGSGALTEKPKILHSKGLELFSSTWHPHSAAELGSAFKAGVLLLVLRNGKKTKPKQTHFVFMQISDYIKEKLLCSTCCPGRGKPGG